MEHAKQPRKDSTMPGWQGSRGGYRSPRDSRNGRYGDAGQKPSHFSRAHQDGEKNPSYRNGIMRD